MTTRRAKPDTAPAPKERDEQAALFRWAALSTARVPELSMLHSIPNTGGLGGGFKANRGMVASMIRTGMRPGYPDIGLDVPAGDRHGLRIELKRIRGSNMTDPDQMAWLERLNGYGYHAVMVRGWIAAAHEITDYLAPRLNAEQVEALKSCIPNLE